MRHSVLAASYNEDKTFFKLSTCCCAKRTWQKKNDEGKINTHNLPKKDEFFSKATNLQLCGLTGIGGD
jgi:hypothetical protein